VPCILGFVWLLSVDKCFFDLNFDLFHMFACIYTMNYCLFSTVSLVLLLLLMMINEEDDDSDANVY